MLVVAVGFIIITVLGVVVYLFTQTGVTEGKYLAVVTNEEA